MNDSEIKYFAAKEPKKVAGNLLSRATSWRTHIESNGLRQKWRDMWRAYHGSYYNNIGDGHEIMFSGEQGELANMAVNHFRNIGQHILVMTTSTRPALNARAINSDYKSLVQTALANSILDYYVREKKLETFLKRAVEYAIVFGAGYVRMEWDASQGDTYDVVEENGVKVPLKDGDIVFSNLTPFDVLFDVTKDDDSLHDWVLIRTFKNKYDLSAKYPEYKEKIEGLPSKSDMENFGSNFSLVSEQTDDVPVYEFYHKRSDSIPDGRFIQFLSADLVLQDRPMPYRVLPIFKICPGTILGTSYGYSPLFDILPIQEATNSLYSTVLTNQSAFGVQNIWCKTGNNLNVTQLSGGLNLIESAEQPVPINLTQTPEEIFKFIGMLEKVMETLSGVNSVARGDPQASLKSGAALALVQSMALQFTSGLQQSYVQLMEDLGTALIKMLQDFANSPRFIAIVGKNNRTEMKQFNSNDISNINRVVVDVGNPLSRTHAGRVQMADNLLQYMPDKINPHQYVNIINTGNLDVMTEEIQNELFTIKAENEEMLAGRDAYAILTDDHREHVLSHRAVLADPELRRDATLVQKVLSHIQEHINLAKNTDPNTLSWMGMQPLAPSMPPVQSVSNPESGEVLQPPTQGMEGLRQEGAEIAGPGLEQPVNLPNVPQVDPNLLPNPGLQNTGK